MKLLGHKVKRLPRRLYKYRDLTVRTFDMVVGDKLHFADPSTFNDPLDTRPSVDVDVDESELRRILGILIERNIASRMYAGAKAIQSQGSSTGDWIKKRSRRQSELRISEMEYKATNSDCDFQTALRSQFSYNVELELLERYESGIVSFAELDDCPLMWSHYGSQHCGICLGYSIPCETEHDVQRVLYGGSRLVKASDVGAMLDGDEEARTKVDAAVMLSKAGSWSYEREWRMIGTRGTRGSPLELEEIIFGMRCKDSVKFTIMKTLQARRGSVKFYEMRENRGTFKLRKEEMAYDNELFVHFPRRNLDCMELFEDLTEGDAVTGGDRADDL